MGASYDSQSGYLTLEQAVELTTQRGGDEVQIHAQHAEFDRGAQTCRMRAATADYRGGQADAAEAKILFRDDGSAETLDAKGGFTLATATGGHVAAPTASMDFDEHSQPRHGHMEGGVTMDSAKEGRTVHGTAPTAELEFGGQGRVAERAPGTRRGDLRKSSDRERGSGGQNGGQARNETRCSVSRTWRSPVVDINFGWQGPAKSAGKGQLELETMRGVGRSGRSQAKASAAMRRRRRRR